MMNNLVDNMFSFYNEIRNLNQLKQENVIVLDEFIMNNKVIPTNALPITNKVVVLDAGHGKPDEGAVRL